MEEVFRGHGGRGFEGIIENKEFRCSVPKYLHLSTSRSQVDGTEHKNYEAAPQQAYRHRYCDLRISISEFLIFTYHNHRTNTHTIKHESFRAKLGINHTFTNHLTTLINPNNTSKWVVTPLNSTRITTIPRPCANRDATSDTITAAAVLHTRLRLRVEGGSVEGMVEVAEEDAEEMEEEVAVEVGGVRRKTGEGEGWRWEEREWRMAFGIGNTL